jgi:hypothetical protein
MSVSHRQRWQMSKCIICGAENLLYGWICFVGLISESTELLVECESPACYQEVSDEVARAGAGISHGSRACSWTCRDAITVAPPQRCAAAMEA